MDFLKNTLNSATSQQGQNQGQQQQQGSYGGGDLTSSAAGESASTNQGEGLLSKLQGMGNNMAGGGQTGEQREDGLDKAVDWVQERMGGGAQNNESAAEQLKDEAISDAIRDQYKGMTGKDFPIADK